MESIGYTLRHAREQKGVSLADVARTTKIKYEILERIESDNTAGLVSPTYTRGFIKLYGEYLGLDGQGLAAAYVDSQGGLRRRGLHVETVASMRRSRELSLSLKRVVRLVAGLTLMIVVVSFVVKWLGNGGSEPPATVEETNGTVAAPATAAPAAVAEVTVIGLPTAEIDAFYQPRKPIPIRLEMPD